MYNFCYKEQGSHLSVPSWFSASVKDGAFFFSSPQPLMFLEATGHFCRLQSKPAYLKFIQVTASLVYPLPILGPTITLRHLPFATGGHVIALWRGHVLNG